MGLSQDTSTGSVPCRRKRELLRTDCLWASYAAVPGHLFGNCSCGDLQGQACSPTACLPQHNMHKIAVVICI